MYLNGKGIKLRGANTMGAFQRCVMRKDWQQLTDDILLAKITHMNYIRIAQTEVAVGGTPTGLHFVSRDTGHRLVAGFHPEDFKFWYDARVDHPTPLLRTSGFQASGWEPVLLTHQAMVAGCKAEGKGCWCICQVELAGRTVGNAVAAIFARRLLETSSPVGR